MSNNSFMMESQKAYGAEHHQQSDYDRLEEQCLSAMNKLVMMRKENAETLGRLEKVTCDLEYQRQQSISAQNKTDELQHKYEQVVSDRNKLQQDYENIVLLREQEMNGQYKCSICKSSEIPHALHPGGSNDMLSKYKAQQDENLKLLEQNSNLNNNYEALKCKCASAIQGFERALKDREKSKQELDLLKQNYDSAKFQLQERSKELKKLKEEKNSIAHEYQLVMSERATVHQEIKELEENLGQTKDKARELNKDKEQAFLEKNVFKNEIQSVLADMDKAKHEARELQKRLQEANKEREELSRRCDAQRHTLQMLRQECSAAKHERIEALVHRDRILKECFDVKKSFDGLDSGDLEMVALLKDKYDKLSKQLTEAWKRTDLALARRDWAWEERDKVLKEYDGLTDRYHSLEKDKSNLKGQMKKLKLELGSSHQKLLELHRENMRLRKTVLNKGSMHQSQDSAIYTESSSYQICQVELTKTSGESDFGFKIGGGKMSASGGDIQKNESSIIICEVVPGSVADNNDLKVNDCILKANDVDLASVDFQFAYETIFNNDHLKMRLLRYSKMGLKSPLQHLEIKGSEEKNIGLSIDSGLYIKQIEPGSAAAEEETLSIGDKILSINGYSIDNMSYDEAKKWLKTSFLSLTVLKPSVSTTSSHRSLVQTDRDDEKLPDNIETYSVVSAEGLIAAPFSHHVRTPSAPTHLGSPEYFLPHNSMSGTYTHVKSMSIINKMTDDDIKKFLTELEEEQKRREHLEMIDEGKPPRSSSFLYATVRNGQHGTSNSSDFIHSRPHRPCSTNSITNSINSSGSNGLHDRISSPSDPLALDFTSRIASSATTSNTSVNSMHPKRLKVRAYSGHTWAGPPPKMQYDSLHPSHSFSHEPASSLFDKSPVHHSTNTDFSDRRTPSHHSVSTSKQGSSRSVAAHYFNTNISHGSLNCDVSETPTPPVHEEEDQGTLLRNDNPASVSARKSGRSSVTSRQGHGSLSSSKRSYKDIDNKGASDEEEPRLLRIDKGPNPLGISIIEGHPNGIFVSSVTEGSYASKYGLKYGDQLLEFNGINFRAADYRQAEAILRSAHTAHTVIVLAHYNPDKIPHENSISTQSTPCTPRKSVISSPSIKRKHTGAGSLSTPGTPVSMHVRLNSNTSSSSEHSKFYYAENKITPIPENDDVGEPRFVHINRVPPSTPLGLVIIGGNDIGIFISDIQKSSLASQSGLRCGDQILKYNDKDMRNNTLEEATLELGKHTELGDLEVQYNPPGYRKAQTQSNDSFYVRAQFDRAPHGKGDLSFRKGDILHVTETLYKGQLGVWRASIIPETDGKPPSGKLTKGKIPSKGKAEQELLLRRSSSHGDDKSKNRKSLFRRSKKGSSHYAINHSRESSDSKADVESTVSGATSFVFVADDFTTYQYVKQLESKFPRPVVIVGAMAEPICDKLVIDSTKKFTRCFEVVHMDQEQVEDNIENGTYLDYKLRGERYEVIATQAVKDFLYKQSKHCLLDVSMESMDRIINNQLHPIIIYIKYKSFKVIKDMRDDHYIKEKLSTKEARELHESYIKMEKDYKHLFHVTINCTSLSQVCKDINDAVIDQQSKVLWVIDE